MKEADLLSALASKFSLVGTPVDRGSETLGGDVIANKAVPVMTKLGDSIQRQWVLYYVDSAGDAYYQDRDPKPTPVPVVTFSSKLQEWITTASLAGTVIKHGQIISANDGSRSAKVEVITVAGAVKMALVTANASLVFNAPVILI